MTNNYQYVSELLETVHGKITLNFQQQRTLAKFGELSLNENNMAFLNIIKKYENLKSRVMFSHNFKLKNTHESFLVK